MERIEADLRQHGLRRRRRPRDRERLAQLHLAEQPAQPSGALDAGHVLRRHQRRRRHPLQPASAHQPDAGALCARAHQEVRGAVERGKPMPRDPRDRAGPHLPRRQRRHPLADVPPVRRPVAGRERELQGPEGRVHRLLPHLLRKRRPGAALSAELLPVHRAQRRDRHPVPERPAGRPLAGGGRLRPGAPARGAQHGPGPREATSASPSAWARTA